LAEAIAGPGVERRPPVQSRVNLNAAHKGLLRVDHDALLALNRLPGISVFTLLDGIAVLPGKNVAGAKIAPVAVPQSVLNEALAIAGRGPVVQVKPFRPHRVAVVTTEGLSGAVLGRFRAAIETKMAWYGSNLTGFTDLEDDPAHVADAISGAMADGADLILTGGGNALDPLDPTLRALAEIGAAMVKFGAPAHPGSMFWLAYCGTVPIFNVASCSLYSRSTVADLVLPWIMAGETVTLDDLAGIGFGGLLDRDSAFRFPPYDAVEDEG
jgi:molybdopterin biosynthesis enzyme